MEIEEVRKEVQSVFRDVLKCESLTLTDGMTSHDVDGWDSLTNMLVISEIEKRLKVRFNLREILRLENVGDLCRAILTKMP